MPVAPAQRCGSSAPSEPTPGPAGRQAGRRSGAARHLRRAEGSLPLREHPAGPGGV